MQHCSDVQAHAVGGPAASPHMLASNTPAAGHHGTSPAWCMSGAAGWGRSAAPRQAAGAAGARWRGDRLFVFCLPHMPFPEHVRPHLLSSHTAQLQEGGHGDQQQGDAKGAVRHAHRQRRRRSWAAHGPEARQRRRREKLAQHCRSADGWRLGLEVTRGQRADTSGSRGAGGREAARQARARARQRANCLRKDHAWLLCSG